MLQFITHHTDRYDEITGTRAVLEGGCRWIQLRMKEAPAETFLRTGREVGRLCRQYGATFILDDRVEFVAELGADGVHLGKNDLPVAEARRRLGPAALLGATANTFADIERAAAAGADYIGLGPFRFTRTKSNLSPLLGIGGYRTIMAQCRTPRRRHRRHYGPRRRRNPRHRHKRHRPFGGAAQRRRSGRRDTQNH